MVGLLTFPSIRLVHVLHTVLQSPLLCQNFALTNLIDHFRRYSQVETGGVLSVNHTGRTRSDLAPGNVYGRNDENL